MQLKGLGLVVLIVVAGCARESAEDFLLKNAVRKYNRALVEVYRMAEPGLLADVASEDEVRKVDVLITTLQMQNKLLRARLERIRFVGIARPGEGKADVKTSEDWSYEHVDRTARQRVGPEKRIHYELIYALERKGGKWIVTGLHHDREAAMASALTRVLARPGFFGTRAPVLPDVALVGLAGLVSFGVAGIWSRGGCSESRRRWAVLGAYVSLLVAGGAWAIQSLLVGNPEVRETLSPLLTSVAGPLGALLPLALSLAVVSGAVVVYRLLRHPGWAPDVVSSPLGVIGLTSWAMVLVTGISQYWLLFVA